MYRAFKISQEETDKKMSQASSLKIVVFLGTVRENRLGLRVAKFVTSQIEKSGHHVDLFDPLVTEFPMLQKPLHFYRGESPPQWLVDANEKIKAADAYVVVSGEYNHSIPPALANMLDHFPGSSFGYKPSGIVCYSPGPFGGVRAAMQLRAMLGEIGCISVSNIFGIPEANKAIDEDGKPQNERMERGANRLLQQLEWHAQAMKAHRQNVGIPQ